MNVCAEKDRYQKPLYARHPMVKFAWTTADYKDTVCFHLTLSSSFLSLLLGAGEEKLIQIHSTFVRFTVWLGLGLKNRFSYSIFQMVALRLVGKFVSQ